MKWMIDPPSGWRYGFPKELDEAELKTMTFEEWLIKNGYPKKDIQFALKYCRRWESKPQEKKDMRTVKDESKRKKVAKNTKTKNKEIKTIKDLSDITDMAVAYYSPIVDEVFVFESTVTGMVNLTLALAVSDDSWVLLGSV